MIRVLIVDDQALVRSGFRVILGSQPDIEVVGEASNGAEAVELAASLHPDVICMDVEMPIMNGIAASRLILAAAQSSPSKPSQLDTELQRPAVLVLTTFGHDEYLFDALDAGVSGFLLKTSRAEQLIEAVRALAAGDALLGPDVTRAVMQRAADLAQSSAEEAQPSADETGRSQAAVEAAGLTEREREVLQLVAKGRSNAEIAADLFLGEATVKTHVSNLLQKTGARDRVQLVVWVHSAA